MIVIATRDTNRYLTLAHMGHVVKHVILMILIAVQSSIHVVLTMEVAKVTVIVTMTWCVGKTIVMLETVVNVNVHQNIHANREKVTVLLI
jgi:hypothetical protein